MRRPRLIPRDPAFPALFRDAAAVLVEASALLVELLERFPDAMERANEIRTCEGAGDEIAHRTVRLLSSTFVTPFDREDIYALSGRLDDICDHIDEAADAVVVYGVRRVPAAAVEQARITHRTCQVLAEAIDHLDGLRDCDALLVDVHRLENEGDRVVREAIADLFSGGEDALVVIRWKDIHEELEAALDSCEHAANVIESIYVKDR